MLNDLFGGWHILIVLAIVVLLFGATRLPALARALGQSRNAFKSEMKKGEESADAKSTAIESDQASVQNNSVQNNSVPNNSVQNNSADNTSNTTPKP
jgi:sec-independent protein translocase protein TatA